MKQILQIIGSEIIGKDLVKVICIPFTSKEMQVKRPSLFDLAKGGGGISELIEQTQKLQSQKSMFFVSFDEWQNIFKNRLFSKIKVDIDLEE